MSTLANSAPSVNTSPGYYSTTPAVLTLDNAIGGRAKALYALLTLLGVPHDGLVCSTEADLAAKLHCTPRTVRRLIAELIAHGYVERHGENGDQMRPLQVLRPGMDDGEVREFWRAQRRAYALVADAYPGQKCPGSPVKNVRGPLYKDLNSSEKKTAAPLRGSRVFDAAETPHEERGRGKMGTDWQRILAQKHVEVVEKSHEKRHIREAKAAKRPRKTKLTDSTATKVRKWTESDLMNHYVTCFRDTYPEWSNVAVSTILTGKVKGQLRALVKIFMRVDRDEDEAYGRAMERARGIIDHAFDNHARFETALSLTGGITAGVLLGFVRSIENDRTGKATAGRSRQAAITSRRSGSTTGGFVSTADDALDSAADDEELL